LRATSRLTVDAQRPNTRAIDLNDAPAASAREIVSRSSSVNAVDARCRTRGLIPPVGATTYRTAAGLTRSALAIDRPDSPARHRPHNSSRCAFDNLGPRDIPTSTSETGSVAPTA
jgi:hypothetical protein